MTRIKRINHWQTVIDGIVTDYKRLNNACNAAIKAEAMDPSGPLYDAIWRAFGGLMDRLDQDGWINWYIYDNDCGKKQMQAKGCGRRGLSPVKTSWHLARLIVESEDVK